MSGTQEASQTMIHVRSGIAALATVLCLCGCTKRFDGKIEKVVDGDSLVAVDEDGERWRVRLGGIDAPEVGQPFGDVATTRLGALVSGREVRVRILEKRGTRIVVGKVTIGDEDDVVIPLLQEGLAWVYPAQADLVSGGDSERYVGAQDQARANGRGFWRDPESRPPWEFRRLKDLRPGADKLKR